MEGGLMTRDDLAKYFQVSPRTIDNLRKEGMPFILIGRNVRFDLEKVNKWLEDQKRNK